MMDANACTHTRTSTLLTIYVTHNVATPHHRCGQTQTLTGRKHEHEHVHQQHSTHTHMTHTVTIHGVVYFLTCSLPTPGARR